MAYPMQNQIQHILSKYRPTSEPVPLEHSTSTEPIVGYRIWSTMKQGGQLYLSSVAYPTQWPYRRALERDAIKDKGIHALKSGPGLSALWSSYYEAAVAGEVYLWGRVTECELGYLAQFAYPKKLFVPDSTDPTVVMGLEDGYGVPCEMRAEFVKQAAGAEMYGTPGMSLYPQSWAQQQQTRALYQQHIQALQNTQQANVAAMMQNAMLYGTATLRTYPGGIFTVDTDTGLPGK